MAKAAARALPSAMTSSADLNSASLKNSLYRSAQSAALWQTSRSGSSSWSRGFLAWALVAFSIATRSSLSACWIALRSASGTGTPGGGIGRTAETDVDIAETEQGHSALK